MTNFRNAVKLATALLALWLGLVWAQALPRPAFLPPEVDIEPLTFLLGAVAALLFGFWKTSAATASAENTTATPPDASIHAELSRYLTARYTQRIGSKLAGRFPVNLRILPSHTGTSDEGKANFITLRDEEVGHEIGEIFDRAKGRLLVVGLPGAGKTTLLLQLALELLKRPNGSLPVLLNLATWRTEFGTFEEWLRRILPNELRKSKDETEKIRATTPLIILLDGLDEVPEVDRDSYLAALGQYGMTDGNQYVVSTRIAEYAAAIDARNINLQVEVAPLDATQIEINLAAQAGANLAGARALYTAIMEKDPLLKQAIENPFYLNTAQLLFASGKNWSESGFAAKDVAGRQRELVQQFVEYALSHKEKRAYPAEKARKWLGFLAGKMEEERLRVFELVDLQPGWRKDGGLIKSVEFVMPLIFMSGIVGLIKIAISHYHRINSDGELTRTLDVDQATNLILSFALILPVIVWTFLDDSPISPTEQIGWSSKKVKEEALNFVSKNTHAIAFCFFVLYLFVSLEWVVTSLIIGVLLVLGLGQALTELFLRGITTNRSLKINYPYQRFIDSLTVFDFSIFLHFKLRLLLYLQSYLPLRLVHFLNEMSRRHLLEFDGDLETESGGGAWRWRHRILQEYFLDEESRERKKA